MNINTRDLSFVNFNGQEMQWLKYNNLLVWEAWKKLPASGILPLTLNKCKGVDLVDYKIYGESVQESKNLIPFPYYYGSRTIGGIEFTVNSDGTVTLNGTATSDGVAFLLTYTSGFQLNAGKYVLSGAPESASRDGYYMVWQNKVFETGSPQTITLTETENVYIYISVKNGTACDNVTFKPQIELNEYTEWASPVVSPENPIEIQSVGDRTINLLNTYGYSAQTLTTPQAIRGTTNNYGTIISTTEPVQSLTINQTQYNLSIEGKNYRNGYFCVGINDEIIIGNEYNISFDLQINKNPLDVNDIVIMPNTIGEYHLTFDKTNTNIQRVSGSFKFVENTSAPESRYLVVRCMGMSFTMSNIMITKKSETLTEYEPYGYKIPIKVSGKNLFNPDTAFLNTQLGTDGNTFANSNHFTSDYIEVKPNTTYYYSAIGKDGTRSGKMASVLYDENKTFVSFTDSTNTITTTSNTKYIRFRRATAPSITDLTSLKAINIQFEEGTIETDYEPYVEPVTTNIYLDEPLRKIGDVEDYIDFVNQKVVRKIKEVSLDGTTNISIHSTTDTYRQFTISKNTYLPNATSYSMLLSSYLNQTSTSAARINNIYLGTNNFNICLEPTYTIEKVEELFNNNPIQIVYILTEEDPQPIELPNIPTHKGITILEVDTKIQPSNAEVVYMGKP